VGFDFNHDSPDTKAYCKRVLNYWIGEYHIDGFRFDLSKGFTQINSYPNDVALWGHYDGNRISILNGYLISMRSIKPDIILILEHFADNDEELDLSNDGMLLWGNMNYNYCEAAMGYVTTSDLSGISYKYRGWFYPSLVGYMESHDEERVMYKCLTWGNSYDWYNVKDTNIALNRAALDAVFFFTIPGPKMIWEFGELGYDYSIEYGGGRLAPKPPRWDYPEDWRRKYLANIYSSLISLKKDQDVFETADYSISLSGALKRINLASPSMNVTVAGNFDVIAGDIIPGFPNTGTWYDYFSGDSLVVTDLSAVIPLDPGEYHIYTSVKLPKPVFTGINGPGSEGWRATLVYPNPATGIVQVLAPSVVIRTELFGITGRLLGETTGTNFVDLSSLPAGLYYLRIWYDQRPPETVKVMKQ
jgi:hypothetical protein